MEIMMHALNYLYREINTHVGLRKYSNTSLATEALKRVASLITSSSSLLPIQLPRDFGGEMKMDLTSFQGNRVHHESARFIMPSKWELVTMNNIPAMSPLVAILVISLAYGLKRLF